MRNRQEIKDNERKLAEAVWGKLTQLSIAILEKLVDKHSLSIALGELFYLDQHWYITHSGLLGVANRRGCAGIHVCLVDSLCNPSTNRWTFRSTVYRTKECKGFVGFGDANPSNTSPLMHGSEMRLAETRAVNRALRKAYGIVNVLNRRIEGPRQQPARTSTRKFKTAPKRRKKPQSKFARLFISDYWRTSA